MAKKKSAQAKGGSARAKKLTPKQRSEIAKKASQARWSKKPMKALREAPLKVGETELECAVLEDETRVISHRAFSRAIGAKRGGSHWQRKKTNPDGANMPVFLSANNLKPFISLELSEALSSPKLYTTESGTTAYGIEAHLIPQILDVWLKARERDALTKSQEPFAVRAEILMRGLAATGIVALIDEATGFQNERDRDALAKILEAFVAKELKQWVKTFDPDYYQEMCRLWGVDYPPEKNQFPQYFGKITNNIVYDRLAPGVRRTLQKKNPKTESGHRKHKHHQYLTEDKGHPALKEHLSAVIALMKVSDKKSQFLEMLDRVKPKYDPMPLFEADQD